MANYGKLASSLIKRNSPSRRCDLLTDNFDDSRDSFEFSVHGCLDAPMLISAGSVKNFSYGQVYPMQTYIIRD